MGFLSDVFDKIDAAEIIEYAQTSFMKDVLGFSGYTRGNRPSGRSLFEVFTNQEVSPVRGSIVCCLLAGILDHSGVYVGNDQIIHRDGKGCLALVSPRTFVERLNGWNPAITIFVSCQGDIPVGKEEVAQRAMEALNEPNEGGYHLLFRNCHQFCHYCLTGGRDNGLLDFTFTSLEDDMKRVYGMNSWRSWNLPYLFSD